MMLDDFSNGPKAGVPFFSLNASRLDPTEAEEAQCDALISLSVDGSRSVAKTWHRWVDGSTGVDAWCWILWLGSLGFMRSV